jgi:hypothetical protein
MTEEAKSGPQRVTVTAEWVRDNLAKQKAYEQSRKMWTSGFLPSQPPAMASNRSRARGKVHDPRQSKLDL